MHDYNGPQSGYGNPPKELLELRSSPPRERADAARNRAAVLNAAAELFREHGVDNVSMDAVAAAAGVGKGTLFRRFGDKAGLAVALLDERERKLQEEICSPGALPDRWPMPPRPGVARVAVRGAARRTAAHPSRGSRKGRSRASIPSRMRSSPRWNWPSKSA